MLRIDRQKCNQNGANMANLQGISFTKGEDRKKIQPRSTPRNSERLNHGVHRENDGFVGRHSPFESYVDEPNLQGTGWEVGETQNIKPSVPRVPSG
jgi:hypothetical protein